MPPTLCHSSPPDASYPLPQVITLNPRCEKVETSLGVQVTVTGVAQIKIMKEEKVLKIASEQFLGMSQQEMVETILMTLEGHLRAILGES